MIKLVTELGTRWNFLKLRWENRNGHSKWQYTLKMYATRMLLMPIHLFEVIKMTSHNIATSTITIKHNKQTLSRTISYDQNIHFTWITIYHNFTIHTSIHLFTPWYEFRILNWSMSIFSWISLKTRVSINLFIWL